MFNFFKKKTKEKEIKGQEKTDKKSGQPINEEEIKIDDIVIHTMPGRLRSSQTKAGRASKTKKTGLFIMIGGAAFLLIIMGGLYYLFVLRSQKAPSAPKATSTAPQINKETEIKQPPKPIQPEQTQPEIKQIAGEAKKTYLSLKSEFDAVKTFSDYERVIIRYGSKSKLVELEKIKQDYNNLEEDKKADFITNLMEVAPKLEDIESIDEKIQTNTANLSIKIKGGKINGVVIMVLEDDKWKLKSEVWPDAAKTDDSSTSASSTVFTAGIDSDKDGLTDKEEILLGSNANLMDSDSDGYNDLAEVMNLYNPAGEDKLISNPNINQYSNSSFNYSLIYPKSWISSNVGGDDTVMFKSVDNQFIQVVAQINSNKESIENWYKKLFNASTINGDKLVSANNWQGIRSENNLNIYLTDKNLNNIITISYIPGSDNRLDYVSIFEMAIKSLEISL